MPNKKKVFISICMDPFIYQRLEEVSTDKSTLIEWLIINYLEKTGIDVSNIYL